MRRDAPILAVFGLELIERRTLIPLALKLLSLLKLLLNALLAGVALALPSNSGLASVGDFLHGGQPIGTRGQTSSWMRHLGDDVLRIPRQDRADRCHIGHRIIGVTCPVAAEEKPRPLRCVVRQLVLTGH